MTRTTCLTAAALVLLAAAPLHAQTFRHLDMEVEPRTHESLEAWLGRAAELRAHILTSAGLEPMPEKTPLNPRVSEPALRDGYTVQSAVLETAPGFYLTGNLYRPAEGEGPFPAILTAHGHWDAGRFEDSEGASIPGRALSFARQGFVVFSYSMIGYNENADVIPHRFDRPEFQLWGFTALGLQLWNSIRALDYLAGLPGVDPERIGMTGASGGGTQTFLLTAVDDRIRVAAPVNMISGIMQGGCVCENAPLLRLRTNNIEIGALAAPRPLLMISTSGDWTHRTPDVEFPAVQAVYRLFDAEERVANVHLDYPHNYNRDSREAAYAWFARWLQDRDDAPKEQPFEALAEDAFSAPLPDDARSLEELFDAHRQRAERQLTAARPDGWREIHAFRAQYGRSLRHVLEVDVDPATLALTEILPGNRTRATRAVLIVHDAERTGAAQEIAETHRSQGEAAFLLHPVPDPSAFIPPDSIDHWTTYNPTPHARRVAEIRAAARRLLDRPDILELDLVGIGEAAPAAMLARAFLPGVQRTRLDFDGRAMDDDEAFLQTLFIPLLRRAGDLRTAAALIAPAPLTVENLPAGPLRAWLRHVYAAAGAGELLRLH